MADRPDDLDRYMWTLADEGEMISSVQPGVTWEELPGRPQWVTAWTAEREFYGFWPVPYVLSVVDDDEWEWEYDEIGAVGPSLTRLHAQLHCWPHDWPTAHKPGYEGCTQCGYIGVREVPIEELTPERRQRLLDQLAAWHPTPQEILAGPIPEHGESALDLLADVLTDSGA